MRGSAGAERVLAPHVDPRWAEALILELRLRDVPGRRIGQVLAEVESHVVEAREDAQSAFGDPAVYAASLELTPGGERAPVVSRLAHPLLHLVAMVVLPVAAAGAATGRVEVTVGAAVALSLVLAAMVVLVLDGARVLRVVLRRPVVSWALLTTAFVLGALGAAGLRTVLVSLPAAPVLAGAGVLLVATTAHALLRARADGVDAIVSPLPGGAAMSPLRQVVASTLVSLVGPLLVTGLAVALVLVG